MLSEDSNNKSILLTGYSVCVKAFIVTTIVELLINLICQNNKVIDLVPSKILLYITAHQLNITILPLFIIHSTACYQPTRGCVYLTFKALVN